MFRLVTAVAAVLLSALRARRELLFENLSLRQQLATLVQKDRPRIRTADRVFWVILRRLWSGWSDALIIVEPETVVCWHRAGFRLYWGWLSRKGKRGVRRPLARDVRDLIRRMASENRWGAPCRSPKPCPPGNHWHFDRKPAAIPMRPFPVTLAPSSGTSPGSAVQQTLSVRWAVAALLP
jgi:hypothetical protein